MDKKDKWDKLGWILFTCVVAIAVSAYTLQYYKIISSLSAALVVTATICVGMLSVLTYIVIHAIQNERKFKKFRKDIKIGDETNKGTVIDITDGVVKIERSYKIENVYPKNF